MDLGKNKTYLKVNERRIRSNKLIYIGDSNDIYITTKESYTQAQ